MRKSIITALVLMAFTGAGCTTDSTWHFPIQFGDSEERVQAIAGMSEHSPDPTKKIHWYPQSGFTIIYDDYKKVTEIVFPNSNNGSGWNRYEKDIFGSIDTQSTYQDFEKQLGEPYENVHDVEFNDTQYTAKWRTDGFGVEAEFYYEDFTENSVTYKKDALSYLSIKKAL